MSIPPLMTGALIREVQARIQEGSGLFSLGPRISLLHRVGVDEPDGVVGAEIGIDRLGQMQELRA